MAQPTSAPPLQDVSNTTGHVAIPPPCYKVDNALLSRIFDKVLSCEGLTPPESQILLGVLPYMPIADSKQLLHLQRILDFPADLLKELAHALQSGLITARNFGGRPGGPSAGAADTSGYISSKRDYSEGTLTESCIKRYRSETSSPNTLPEAVFSSEDIMMDDNADLSPPERVNTPTATIDTPDARLLSALQIQHVLPKSTNQYEVFNRRRSFADECLIRQSDICPITGHKNEPYVVEVAHIVPHSVATITNLHDTPFWRLLTICFGPEIRDEIYSIVGGGKSARPANGLALDSSVHKMFDRGLVWLIPHMNGPFDPESTTYYDVEFCWRGELTELESLGTIMPIMPDEQVDMSVKPMRYRRGPLRTVRNGDRFRLFTNNPSQYPLTHPFLLSLHNSLWNMIASSGLSETGKAKQHRQGSTASTGTERCGAGGARRGSNSSDRRAHRYRRRGSGRSSPGSASQTPQEGGLLGKKPMADSTTRGNQYVDISTSESMTMPPTGGILPIPIEEEFLLFKLRQVAEQRSREYDSDEYYSDDAASDEYWSDSDDEFESRGEADLISVSRGSELKYLTSNST